MRINPVTETTGYIINISKEEAVRFYDWWTSDHWTVSDRVCQLEPSTSESLAWIKDQVPPFMVELVKQIVRDLHG